jgi:lysine decarboxylase
MTLAHATGKLATGPPHRGRVVVQRNVHTSTIDGLVLSGLRPTFVAPEIDQELGIAHCVTPEGLDAALESEPEAVAAMLVSPTYFGAVARIEELAEVAHARNVPLVVDEAWGSHLYFHEALPTGALRSGADMVLSSTHKIIGSLTQSAILHLGKGGQIDQDIIDRSVTLVESTSPNALLTASLDAARRFAATRGEELLSKTLKTLARTREEIREIPGLDVLDERLAGRMSVAAWDPLRLSVDVRGTGATGHRIAQLMRERDDIILELYSENVIVAVSGIGETPTAPAERLVEGLRHAVEEIGPGDLEERRAFAEPPPWGPLELAPRDAFLGPQVVVPFEAAEGRIAAESLAAYPPGVPNVLPGERLTAPTLSYIADSLAHGGLVRGASDRSLRTVRVVEE